MFLPRSCSHVILPPIGAAKQQPTPTAQAADSISVFRSSFCPTRIRYTHTRTTTKQCIHRYTHTQSKEVHSVSTCNGQRRNVFLMKKQKSPVVYNVSLWGCCCIFAVDKTAYVRGGIWEAITENLGLIVESWNDMFVQKQRQHRSMSRCDGSLNGIRQNGKAINPSQLHKMHSMDYECWRNRQ